MNKQELDRLIVIEKRIKEIAIENGLLTTEIDFEVVPAQRMLESLAYHWPTNFSHWSFGRDYEKYRTIYDHTGAGIPYEQVWNFETPRALIVETNPFPLKVLVVAHVYGHVDYFLNNRFSKQGRSFSDIAEEARHAANRFREYEENHGKELVERTIDAGFSLKWQQHPDPFMEEELDNEMARERLVAAARAKLEYIVDFESEFKKPESKEEREKIRTTLRGLRQRTPPEPIYDLLGYIIRYSPTLRDWQKYILSVIRNQAGALAPNMRTKMANEGWATYWHVRIMRQLFQEGLLTADEHGVFNDFHSGVTRENKLDFNWYRIGQAIFENIKERWDKGRFGRYYEDCENPTQKAYWDTAAGQGTAKIFQVRSCYSDRMIVEELFTDEFIREMKLYIYEEQVNEKTGERIYIIRERDPEAIRQILKQSFASHGVMPIRITNADFNDSQQLYLEHQYFGQEIQPNHRNGTLENIFFLWGRKVNLETVVNEKPVVCTYNGKEHKTQK